MCANVAQAPDHSKGLTCLPRLSERLSHAIDNWPNLNRHECSMTLVVLNNHATEQRSVSAATETPRMERVDGRAVSILGSPLEPYKNVLIARYAQLLYHVRLRHRIAGVH